MKLKVFTYRLDVADATHRWCPLDFSRYGLGVRIGGSYRGFTVYNADYKAETVNVDPA